MAKINLKSNSWSFIISYSAYSEEAEYKNRDIARRPPIPIIRHSIFPTLVCFSKKMTKHEAKIPIKIEGMLPVAVKSIANKLPWFERDWEMSKSKKDPTKNPINAMINANKNGMYSLNLDKII